MAQHPPEMRFTKLLTWGTPCLVGMTFLGLTGTGGGCAGEDQATGGSGSTSSTTVTTTEASVTSAASTSTGFASGSTGSGEPCVDTTTPQPPLLDDTENKLADEYVGIYTPYDLGPVPGLEGKLLGGCATKPDDPSKLLVVGGAEYPGAAVYEIGVSRDTCGHIVGFVGTAAPLVTVDHADATVVVTSSKNLLLPLYPTAKMAQVETSGWTDISTWDLAPPFAAFNDDDWTPGHQSAGGMAFVPESIAPGAKLRAAGYPMGDWIHIELAANPVDPGRFDFVSASKANIVLPNGPGGIAYVPAGSPAFPNASLIVIEWLAHTPPELQVGHPQRVAVYEVDTQGDPIVSTRKDFFTEFDHPWGAYFEQQTGDFMFLSWALNPDHFVEVRGFAKPPEPPPPS